VTDPEGRTTEYASDSLNRRVRTTFPALQPGDTRLFTETTYDEAGRRTSERDPAGRITRFHHDKVGRLTRIIDAEGGETEYGYDELGNRTGQTDAEGRLTRLEYDVLGRQIRRVLPGGATEELSYDAAGNVLTRRDFAGRVTTYAYNEVNRLVARTYPEPFAAQNVSFTYWPTGRRRTATDSRGTTSYDYDLRDRVAVVTYPDGRKLDHVWDGNGNRTSLTATLPGSSPLVLTAGFAYDDANRLDVVTDPVGRTHDHGYDKNGNRTSLAQPNGTATGYTYDVLNRLRSLGTTRVADSGVVQGYSLELGPAGNRTRITEADGSVKQYGYDNMYRLTTEAVSGLLGYNKTFVYDAVGNRQSQATSGPDAGPPGTVEYVYDDRDRLTFEGIGAYAWDENGNLVSRAGQASYTWDLENRLVRVESAGGTVVTHAYDVDGNRVQTTTTPSGGGPSATHFLVDTSTSLSHVVLETAAGGALQAFYVRGADLLAVMRPLAPVPATATDWQTRYYHADPVGSVRRLTDEAGQITDGYTYTAFGELLGHTGSDPQPYAFAGEPLDSSSGLQYHRARWLDPRTGRFLGMDPFPGSQDDPVSLHRYLYAGADPVALADPTGEFSSLAGAFMVVAIVAILAGISSIACSPLRRPKTAGLHWIATPPSSEAQVTKSNALEGAKRGIEPLGVVVTQSPQADYRLQVVPTPGGRPPAGAIGQAFVPERRGEIFYFRTRTVVLALRRDPTLAAGLTLAESLGHALGFVAVHEFGHLVVPDADYHEPADPSAYNTTGLDSAAPGIMNVNLLNGLGHWPGAMKARLMRNLGTR
jgi:RHS repeat-associated protein